MPRSIVAVRSAAVIFFQFFFIKTSLTLILSAYAVRRNGSGIERVDELLDERFFHISVESEKTDEGEKLRKSRSSSGVLEGLFGDGGFFLYILPEL